ncbi:MAG: pentapeptide repeat-containing protein [Gemmatimonadetes bacterium]|nr:pentapeptide repeat-containing protein [Gemmatimonadota bacterium]
MFVFPWQKVPWGQSPVKLFLSLYRPRFRPFFFVFLAAAPSFFSPLTFFTGASSTGASFTGASFTGASFTGACFTGACNSSTTVFPAAARPCITRPAASNTPRVPLIADADTRPARNVSSTRSAIFSSVDGPDRLPNLDSRNSM